MGASSTRSAVIATIATFTTALASDPAVVTGSASAAAAAFRASCAAISAADLL